MVDRYTQQDKKMGCDDIIYTQYNSFRNKIELNQDFQDGSIELLGFSKPNNIIRNFSQKNVIQKTKHTNKTTMLNYGGNQIDDCQKNIIDISPNHKQNSSCLQKQYIPIFTKQNNQNSLIIKTRNDIVNELMKSAESSPSNGFFQNQYKNEVRQIKSIRDDISPVNSKSQTFYLNQSSRTSKNFNQQDTDQMLNKSKQSNQQNSINFQRKYKNLHNSSLNQILKIYQNTSNQDLIQSPTQVDAFQLDDNLTQNIQKNNKIQYHEGINYTSSKQFKIKQDIIYQKQNTSNSNLIWDQQTKQQKKLNSNQNNLNTLINKMNQNQVNKNNVYEYRDNTINQNNKGLNIHLNKSQEFIGKRSTQPDLINQQINANNKAQVLKFGTRELLLPIQSKKQVNNTIKYEESLNSYLLCNNTQEKDVSLKKYISPFQVSLDKSEIKLNTNSMQDSIVSTRSINSVNPNKFIKFDSVLEGSGNKTQSFLSPKNKQSPTIKQLKQITIGEQHSISQKSFQSPKQLNKSEVEQSFMTKEQVVKQNNIQNIIKNRNQIGDLIKLIEESPLDCIKDLKYNKDTIKENDIFNRSKKISQISYQKSIESEFSPKQQNSDFYNMNDKDQDISNLNLSAESEQMKLEQKKKFLDLSFTEQAKQVEDETKEFILNKERVADFMPIRTKKDRKNLDGKALRSNLTKVLNYLKDLKLKPRELLNNHVFSKKPFEKPNSYNLIIAAKHNDYIQCLDILTQNKYLVYDFDYVYMTALHWSCKRGYAKLSQFLIDKGADVNAQDIRGKTPLYYAAEQGHLEVVRVLLYNKAYPWSTKYVNYEKFEKQYPLISSALLTARKINVLLKMTPFKQRNMVWQKQGIAFAQILA